MNPKQEECLLILNEIQEMIDIVIDSGAVNDMEPIEIIEETVRAFKILSTQSGIAEDLLQGSPKVNKKRKGLLH